MKKMTLSIDRENKGVEYTPGTYTTECNEFWDSILGGNANNCPEISLKLPSLCLLSDFQEAILKPQSSWGSLSEKYIFMFVKYLTHGYASGVY